MKQILRMYIYLPLTLLFFGLVVRQMLTQAGGKEPMEAENLNVKNIRANPTSFRAVYMPRILAGGGK
ncbi:MAG TPA: hypothetical protein PKM44_07540 [Turneriella sp.]|nr:hypothetical protein [Turneriella sp.]HNL54748.1 hypothetical protein [Turneriella sp.]